jgi:mono/diheme cytochrome c family protein
MKIAANLALFLLASAASAQDRPGDARRGAQLFEQQHCVACHSINGTGGKIAPDLARRSLKPSSPSILAANIWNHAPAMWRLMAASGLPIPKLEPSDVADLFAYFYSLHYFAQPGDAARGKDVFQSAGCSRCHLSGPGPPLLSWKATADPIEWAQQMWNHSRGMTLEAEKRGVRWPQLESQQVVDLMTYAHNLPGAGRKLPALHVEDPAAGARLFESKQCVRCHSFGPEPDKIDLLRRAERFRTLVDFATAMWNHGPQMQRRFREAGIEAPVFQNYEMSDLLAYLFDRHYFDERGSASRGARLYRSRHCASCHDTGEAGAPKLSQFRGRFSAMFLTSALWKHGPQMLAEMQKRGWEWPQFANTQMADLIAYLNR